MKRPEELTTPLYSLGEKLFVDVCRSTTTPYSGSNFWRHCHLLVSPESYWFDNLGIFTEGNLMLHCISNLPLGVTNEGREAIRSLVVALCPHPGDSGRFLYADFLSDFS